MKAILKTFLMMFLFGVLALLLSSLLLHTKILANPLKPSYWWLVGRCAVYIAIILWRNKIAAMLVKRYRLEPEASKTILPKRWKLILFFSGFELLIIQGSLAWLISLGTRWL